MLFFCPFIFWLRSSCPYLPEPNRLNFLTILGKVYRISTLLHNFKSCLECFQTHALVLAWSFRHTRLHFAQVDLPHHIDWLWNRQYTSQIGWHTCRNPACTPFNTILHNVISYQHRTLAYYIRRVLFLLCKHSWLFPACLLFSWFRNLG